MSFKLAIYAAHAIDAQRLHIDPFAFTEPLGVVAEDLDGNRIHGGFRDVTLLEKSFERVFSAADQAS
jgi:hypothetical protein